MTPTWGPRLGWEGARGAITRGRGAQGGGGRPDGCIARSEQGRHAPSPPHRLGVAKALAAVEPRDRSATTAPLAHSARAQPPSATLPLPALRITAGCGADQFPAAPVAGHRSAATSRPDDLRVWGRCVRPRLGLEQHRRCGRPVQCQPLHAVLHPGRGQLVLPGAGPAPRRGCARGHCAPSIYAAGLVVRAGCWVLHPTGRVPMGYASPSQPAPILRALGPAGAQRN